MYNTSSLLMISNEIILPIMPDLSLILDAFSTLDEKHEFMNEVFIRIKTRVDEVLSFGPCNNQIAEKANSVYYYNRKQTNFFPVNYRKDEREALPAVIANILCLDAVSKQRPPETQDLFERHFASGYLYGTGTCEVFAIIGAYILATEFDVELSIETIYSNASHTYIKLHTNPEYIFDFWATMMCQHDDQLSWNEFFDESYIRDEQAVLKTEIVLNSGQLIEMGKSVFTEHNERLRVDIHNLVQERVSKETNQLVLKDKNVSLSFS
jgi:hypothetical protein